MKKEFKNLLLSVLFFSALWGLSEAFLGGFLYNRGIAHASVYLTIIGFSVLTIARVYLPGRGILIAIAALAMLYKFLNTPFFACHLLGILLLGVSYDLFFNILKLKNRSICAAAATYTGYGLFALMITYVFRYSSWVEGGLPKVLNYVGVGGTLVALGCALVVPLSHKFGEWLQTNKAHTYLADSFASVRLTLVTTGMWLFAMVTFVVQYHHNQL